MFYTEENAINPVPQIKLVTLDSNIEYGLSILEYLNEEIRRRGTVFRSAGATKIQEFREKGGQMPRILLIIDEFQKLFDGRREIALTSLMAIHWRHRQDNGRHDEK